MTKRTRLEAPLWLMALFLLMVLSVGIVIGTFIPSRLDPVRQCAAGGVYKGELHCVVPVAT